MNVEELLPAYVTGELLDDDRAKVEAALAESAELRAELARYQRLFVLFTIAATEDLRTPADLSTRIMRQVVVTHYLTRITNFTYDLAGAYGRAIIFYLGLR